MSGQTITLYIRDCSNKTRSRQNLTECATKMEIDRVVSDIFVDTLTIYDQLDFNKHKSGLRA